MKNRRSIRLESTGSVVISAIRREDMNVKATIHDGSRVGLSLLVERPVKRGEILWLEISFSPKKKPISAIARVKWSKRVDRKNCGAGVEFVNIRKTDLADLLDHCYEEWKSNIKKNFKH